MALAFAGAAILGLLGVVHLACTLHDFGARPKFFSPTSSETLADMRATKTAIAPRAGDYWSGILGFHFSHSLGFLLFALMITTATVQDIGWLKPILTLLGICYVAISLRCWFAVPTAGLVLSVGLISAGWWL